MASQQPFIASSTSQYCRDGPSTLMLVYVSGICVLMLEYEENCGRTEGYSAVYSRFILIFNLLVL